MAIQQELELTFPAQRVTQPILSRMAREHDVVFNIASANVSHARGHFHLTLLGEDAAVKDAERFLRDAGVEVKLIKSGPYAGQVPPRPKRQQGTPGEEVVSRKLWITYMDDFRRGPATWEMACTFDVTFDVRQSSTGPSVSIMAMLLEGPRSQVEGAIEFLRRHGAEVEPIEKSVIEG